MLELSEETYWSVLLILHGLISVALLGAISHQAYALINHKHDKTSPNLPHRFGSVQASLYTSSVCVLWVLTTIIGGWIYTKYRIAIRIPMEQQGFWLTQGFFELKEHLVTLGLLMLPAYFALWKYDHEKQLDKARKYTTITLSLIAWYTFLVGHIVNNVRGFGS